MVSRVVLVVVVLIALSQAAVGSCPDAQSILPCKCFYGGVSVQCDGVKSFLNFKAKFTSRPRLGTRLKLKDVNESTFDDSILSGLKLFTFTLSKSNVTSFSENAFSSSRSTLLNLNLVDTCLESIPAVAISKLDKLLSLAITGARLSKIYKNDIDKLPSTLKSVSLSGNPITAIEEGAFLSLTKLQYLILNHCALKTLPNNWFSSGVTTFSMGHNLFSSLPIEAFAKLNKGMVNLMFNKIKSIPQNATIDFLNRGNNLQLMENPLNCTCDFKWIPKYGAIKKDWSLMGNCFGDEHRKHKSLIHLESKDFKDCH